MRKWIWILGLLICTIINNSDVFAQKNSEGIVSGKWQKCNAGQSIAENCKGESASMSFDEGINYCSTLKLGGEKWRLPTRLELFSLAYAYRTKQIRGESTSDEVFLNWENGYYWAAGKNEPDKTDSWLVNFYSREITTSAFTSKYVRCVLDKN
jgi:hypothetical protein